MAITKEKHFIKLLNSAGGSADGGSVEEAAGGDHTGGGGDYAAGGDHIGGGGDYAAARGGLSYPSPGALFYKNDDCPITNDDSLLTK